MKKILVMVLVAMTIVACATKNAEPQKAAAQQLLERLDSLLQKGIMYGHQDDPMYGLTWEYDKDSSDVKNVCGRTFVAVILPSWALILVVSRWVIRKIWTVFLSPV